MNNTSLSWTAVAGAGLGSLLLLGPVLGQQGRSPRSPRTPGVSAPDRSLVQRGPVPPAASTSGGGPADDGGPPMPPEPAHFPGEFRTIDGTLNNPGNDTWGAAGIRLLRITPADYADGAHDPAGAIRVSAREVSNAIAAQVTTEPNANNASDYLWQWGQFLDHDIDETPIADPAEAFDIEVPEGDPWFDPAGDGDRTIGLDRSAWEMSNGARQQLNNITAYIDASNVYGSDETNGPTRSARNDDTGRLAHERRQPAAHSTSTAMLPNAPTSSSTPRFFLAGDIRANEQVGLTAMHTLFVREHNHWARQLHRGSGIPSSTGR